MSERTDELKRLCRRFGNDTKALLTEYPALENLRVFSDRREGLLEWFSFRKGASLLQAGSGAGSLPTASAVCGDVIDCVKHLHTTIRVDYSSTPLSLLPVDEVARPFFVRMKGGKEAAEAAFGPVTRTIQLDGLTDEIGVITEMMPEKEFKQKLNLAEGVISWYRRGKNEEAKE